MTGSASDHCITCGDDGVPMSRHCASRRATRLALCADDDGSKKSTVEIALVEPVALDDRVLVHAGVALVRLD